VRSRMDPTLGASLPATQRNQNVPQVRVGGRRAASVVGHAQMVSSPYSTRKHTAVSAPGQPRRWFGVCHPEDARYMSRLTAVPARLCGPGARRCPPARRVTGPSRHLADPRACPLSGPTQNPQLPLGPTPASCGGPRRQRPPSVPRHRPVSADSLDSPELRAVWVDALPRTVFKTPEPGGRTGRLGAGAANLNALFVQGPAGGATPTT